MELRLRLPSGNTTTLTIQPDITYDDFLAICNATAGTAIKSVLAGFPPRPLSLAPAEPVSSVIRDRDTVTLVADTSAASPAPHTNDSTPQSKGKRGGAASASGGGGGGSGRKRQRSADSASSEEHLTATATAAADVSAAITAAAPTAASPAQRPTRASKEAAGDRMRAEIAAQEAERKAANAAAKSKAAAAASGGSGSASKSSRKRRKVNMPGEGYLLGNSSSSSPARGDAVDLMDASDGEGDEGEGEERGVADGPPPAAPSIAAVVASPAHPRTPSRTTTTTTTAAVSGDIPAPFHAAAHSAGGTMLDAILTMNSTQSNYTTAPVVASTGADASSGGPAPAAIGVASAQRQLAAAAEARAVRAGLPAATGSPSRLLAGTNLSPTSSPRKRVKLPTSQAGLEEALVGAGRGGAAAARAAGASASAVDYLRAVSQSALNHQYDITRANTRLAAALAGSYEITPLLTSRILGSGAPAQLRVRWHTGPALASTDSAGAASSSSSASPGRHSKRVHWDEEVVDAIPAAALRPLLTHVVSTGDAGREMIKPHMMAQCAPRTFWAVVRYGGALSRGEPLPPPTAVVAEGRPVHVEAALAALAPALDWSFLSHRAKKLTEKALAAEAAAAAAAAEKEARRRKRLGLPEPETEEEEGDFAAVAAADGGGEAGAAAAAASSTAEPATAAAAPVLHPSTAHLEVLRLCAHALRRSNLAVAAATAAPAASLPGPIADAVASISKVDAILEVAGMIPAPADQQQAQTPSAAGTAGTAGTAAGLVVQTLLALARLGGRGSSPIPTAATAPVDHVDALLPAADGINNDAVIAALGVAVWKPQPSGGGSSGGGARDSKAQEEEEEEESQTFICDACGKGRLVFASEADLEALQAAARFECGKCGVHRLQSRGGCAAPCDELSRLLGTEHAAAACQMYGLPLPTDVAAATLPDEDIFLYQGPERPATQVDLLEAEEDAAAETAAEQQQQGSAAAASSGSSAPASYTMPAGLSQSFDMVSDLLAAPDVAAAPQAAQGAAQAQAQAPAEAADQLLTVAQWCVKLRGRTIPLSLAISTAPPLCDATAPASQYSSLAYPYSGHRLLYAAAHLLTAAVSQQQAAASAMSSSSSSSCSSSAEAVQLAAAALLRHPAGWSCALRLAREWQGYARYDVMREHMMSIVGEGDKADSGTSAGGAGRDDAEEPVYLGASSGELGEQDEEEEAEPDAAEVLISALEELRVATPADLLAQPAMLLLAALRRTQAAALAAADSGSSAGAGAASAGLPPARNAVCVRLADVQLWQDRTRELIKAQPWLANVLTDQAAA